MSKTIKKILNIAFPILLGSLIIILFYRQLDQKAIAEFKNHIKTANYFWVFIAVFVTFLSHLSRAMRWQMMIKSLNYQISFSKAFYSLFVNYLVNLGIPRTGEIARCAVLTKYDNIPFDKSFGSLVNERIIDVLFLALVGGLVAVFQFDIFFAFVKKHLYPIVEKKDLSSNYSFYLIIIFIVIAIIALILWLIKNNKFPLQTKFKKALSGVKEGIFSIFKLDKPLLFVVHSVFIWLMYWLMTYLIFFSVQGGEDVTAMMALSILFFGTFAFIIVSGGFGAYPVALGVVLSLYGLDPLLGNAAGWLLWGAQTIMILFFGALSFFMLSLGNKRGKALILENDK